MDIRNLKPDQLTLVCNTIRMLSADAVEKANSGHPGMPMGMAECAAVLWLKYLRINPKDPSWFSRDRFVLSNGHGSMLLYTMLHLSGFDVSLDDLKSFRQFGSKTPGHPENFATQGVEATTGPLGQGISNAVGMAIGSKLLNARYNADAAANEVFDNKIFVFAGDGCLMEGVSGEAGSLAGHLGLGNIIVVYDDNHISIAGHTDLAFSEDVLKRYEAYGWHTQRVDGHDAHAVDGAIATAIAETSKPSIIAARTLIGKGSPNKVDTHDVHGAPLGKSEMEATRKNLNWNYEPFTIPDETKKIFAERSEELRGVYDRWQQSFKSWKTAHQDLSNRLEKQLKRFVPEDFQARMIAALPKDGKAISTRKLSGEMLQVASEAIDSLIGGSADLEPSTLTLIKKSTALSSKSFSGVNIHFGVREHAMGAVLNGLSYYGGFLPYGSTFMCFADYMRPAIRLAALSHLPSIFIFTHESIFLGEDGPTHQPIEHLSALRAIPNLWVFRPADGLETAVCYRQALTRRDGPSLMAFTRQNLDVPERKQSFDPNEIAKGAYNIWENTEQGPVQLVLIATGSEVSLALKCARELAKTLGVRVVSMPCWEIFMKQSEDYRAALIPENTKKVVIEAAATFGWLGMLDLNPKDTLLIGIDHFGASAPAEVLAEKFGLTPGAIVPRIKQRFALK